MKELIDMKIYVIRYYNEISGEMENYGVFGSKEKAAEFCNKANENFSKICNTLG